MPIFGLISAAKSDPPLIKDKKGDDEGETGKKLFSLLLQQEQQLSDENKLSVH